MVVKIWIKNSDAIEEAEREENLGLTPGNKDLHELVDFEFKEDLFVGFWVDPEVDPTTQTRDIRFFIRGVERGCSTPFTAKLADKFRDIINNRVLH